MKLKIGHHYREQWQLQWNNSNSAHRKMKPSLGNTLFHGITRRHQKVLTRLRLGACVFTHSHFYSGSPPPDCPACKCRLTIQHVLIDCHRFSCERQLMQQHCSQAGLTLNLVNILSPDFPASMVIQYLNAIQYTNKI